MKKITLLVLLLIVANNLFAQQNNVNGESGVITCSEFHITRPLSEIFAEHPVNEKKLPKKRESEDRENRKPQKFIFSVTDGPQYGNDPKVIQTKMGDVPGRAPITNWPGQFATNFRPMDPCGAAGPNHYVQMINSTTFKVYNKTTGANILTGTFGSLWSPATPNDGDPVILYDKAANRWFMSQFGSSGNKMYIAISQTADPAGAYYTYTFSSSQFPDYLKFSVWQDGYYMTSNQGTQKVFAFERALMLAGNPGAHAVFQTFSPPHVASLFFVPLPGDAADGTLPPAGTPCPIFSYSDNGWGAGFSDAVNIYQMSVNWVALTSTITLAANVPAAAFDATYDANWNDVSQPGTTQKLDGIGGVCMFRAQWKSWAGYNTVVLNWGVKISATQRSIKWCELRQNQTTLAWSMFQEGIYTPDADTRWMGSIAMDNNGGIALAYMKSNSTSLFPGLYYAGRRSCDPLGTLPVTESIAIAGTISQFQSGTPMNRDGDYADLVLDPDGVTFWHTSEYMGGTAGAFTAARTQIFSFQLPTCGSPVASVSIAQTAGTNPQCAGTSATFTATPTNGGTTPVYQWQVNGTNVGTNSTTYTTNSLSNGQVVTCIMTSNLVGVTGNPATSNGITMTVNVLPSSTITGSASVCSGSSVQWCAPAGLSFYKWSTGATTQCITVSTAGTYTDTVTNANGCKSFSSQTLTVNSLPSSTITGNSSVCSGSSVQWCAPAGLSSYKWNTGATTQCITVSTAGTYTDTVTNANGCKSFSSQTLTVNSLPSSTITGNASVCSGSSVQWCAPAGLSSYKWSTGATTQCITVSTAGTYTDTVTNANGCKSFSSQTLTVNSLPSSTITGSASVCSGSSIQWCAPAGLSSYKWSTGATTQCITVSAAGTYTDTVTNANGCKSFSSQTLSVNALPSSTITGTASVCSGSSVQWCAPAGLSSYTWSTGATTQCITVSAAGTYTDTVTNANGCKSFSSQTLSVNVLPSSTITGSSSVCSGSSVQWCAPAGLSSYTWSTGATTQCITVSTAGTYTDTVTNANGCKSFSSQTLTVNSLPSSTITGSASVCSGSSVQWCAPAGLSSYTWSTGATTQCITVSTAGIYTDTVTNANGCKSFSSQTLTVNSLPSSTITGSASVCSGSSVQWCAPAGLSSYKWSTGATTQCITVSTAGTYTDTVTNANGCKSFSSQTLTVNSLPSSTITGSASVCSGSSVQWCAPAGLSSYKWSTGATTQCITVSAAGTYTDTVTNANGCKSFSSQTLTVNSLPSSAITGSNSVCSGSSVQWCAPAGLSSYTWSTGATTQCITVSAAGTYTDTVTNANGCKSFSSQTLTVNALPSVSITGSTSFCTGSSTTLDAGAGFNTYSWSTGETTQIISVNIASTFTVTVSNSNECTGTASASTTITPCAITLNLKVFIEGFYKGGNAMISVADPSGHPLECDTITVELHNANSPYDLAEAKTGTISTSGNGSFVFTALNTGASYYIVVRHRNSMETWSKNPVLFNTLIVNFDFTSP